MIQRLQTVYITLFSILLFIASFLPFAQLNFSENFLCLKPTGWESNSGDLIYNAYYVGYLVAIAFAILMVVNYKKRVKQLRYGKLCYLIVLVTLVYMFFLVNTKADFILETEELKPTIKYLSGMYCLVASLPLMFLANRAIKKDEKLVKSLDRLR